MRTVKQKPFKIAVVGTQEAGKTSLINRFHYDTFERNTIATVGASFVLHVFETESGDVLTFQIWDTAGQEKYRSLGPIYYRDAVCAISVFDLTSAQSFEEMKDFIDEFSEHCIGYVHIAVVGNKKDLCTHTSIQDGGVNIEKARQWATDLGYSFHLTSALTGEGVESMFQSVAEAVGGVVKSPKGSQAVNLNSSSNGSSRCC